MPLPPYTRKFGQSQILRAVDELTRRISDASRFIQRRLGAVLPQRVQAVLQALPGGMARIKSKAASMVPSAIKELNENLARVRQHLTDGSYIAPITVAGRKSTVYVTEGRLVSEKVILGHVEHPPASLSQYRHREGRPDLESLGMSKLPDLEDKNIAQATGHLWPINTFSAKAPMVAFTVREGDVLYRVLDKTGDKYLKDFHRAGDCWTPHRPKNGHDFRTTLAVLHAWNANGYIEMLKIPSRAELEQMRIAVPAGWEGLRTWRGGIAGQLDSAAEVTNGLRNTNRWLEGGGVQDFVDWRHPHNAPVKEYLLRKVQVKPTGWTDLQLPIKDDMSEPNVVTLRELERSAKIAQEGYLPRGAAVAGKQTHDHAEER